MGITKPPICTWGGFFIRKHYETYKKNKKRKEINESSVNRGCVTAKVNEGYT